MCIHGYIIILKAPVNPEIQTSIPIFLQRHMANQTFMDKSEPSAKTEMQNEYFSSQHAILTAQHPLRIQKIPVVQCLVGAL